MSARDETPEERIARLERELSDAKAAQLERQLAEAKVDARAADGALPDASDDDEKRPETSGTHRQSRSPIDERLAPAPRRIPFGFLLAELLAWGGWYLFVFFVCFVFPGACWFATSVSDRQIGVAGAVVVLLVLAVIRYGRVPKRLSLLRRGEVATVLSAEVVSEGTYYSGTTYSNMIIPVARGWKVDRKFYSGPEIVTRVRYRVGSIESEFYNGGREYVDGIILADPKRPGRALCVSAFPYDLDRDPRGQWTGRLRPGLLVLMGLTVVILAVWIGGIAAVITSPLDKQSAAPKLSPASLATQTFSGWESIDAPGMVGTFAAFDTVANYDWALSVGRAWKADAVLYRLAAVGVAKDGLIDFKTTPKASATYRLYSPACVREYEESATTVVAPVNRCGFMLEVRADQGQPPGTRVYIGDGPSTSATLDPELGRPVCTLSKAFAALAQAGKLPPRPVYTADVYVVGSEPSWTFLQMSSGASSIGSVNATSCALK